MLEPLLPPAIFYNLLLSALTRRWRPVPRAAGPAPRLFGVPDRLTREFPLFPLGIVALPGELIPLHIFEERYKAMMDECLRGRERVRDRLAGR